MSAANVADGVAEAHDDSVEEGALVAAPDPVSDSSESRPDIGPSTILKEREAGCAGCEESRSFENHKGVAGG